MDKPAEWLVANVDLIPATGTVLDVACGSGRHALFLAARGWRVHAVDRDAAALARLRETCDGEVTSHHALTITTEAIDLEADHVSLGSQCYQAVIVFNYLHRPLMPAIVDAVAPGGVLIYETFTTAQAARGRPKTPAFLLEPDELPSLVRPLRVVRAREGEIEGKFVASVAAMR